MAFDDLVQKLAAKHEASGGNREEQAATAELVLATMHHDACKMVRELKKASVEASVRGTSLGFSLTIAAASVEVDRLDARLLFRFRGFSKVVAYKDQEQELAVLALNFESALELGRQVLA